jgi:hypothetical protein
LNAFLEAFRGESIDWHGSPGAAPAEIARLRRHIPGVPEAYLEFLASMNGGDGSLPTEAPITYLRLWPADRSIQYNIDYEVQRWLPDHWGIGDNGGSEMLAFDRAAPGWPLCTVPFVPLEAESCIPVAPNFSDLLRRLGKRATA